MRISSISEGEVTEVAKQVLGGRAPGVDKMKFLNGLSCLS